MEHAPMHVAASWNPALVVLSYAVAVLASYTALDLAGRVVASRGWARRLWLAGGAFAMGTGIWSMHFTGMLAFGMGMPVTYNIPTTLLSVLIAIAASGLALIVVGRGAVGPRSLLVAGPVMGVGIAAMHYTGMAAMRMAATITYKPGYVTLSVLIAVSASVAALYLFFHLNRGDVSGVGWLKGVSALVMGGAIVGMHYTGMAAADFTPTGEASGPSYDVSNAVLGFGIGIFTLVILGLALISAMVDRRFSAQAAELTESESRFESSFRDAAVGMALVRTDGRFLQVNRALCRILGYSEDELLGKTFQEITHPDDLAADLDQVRGLLNGDAHTYQIEKRYICKDNDPVWSLLNVSLVRDAGDEPRYFISQVQDISKRKEAEEELRRLNETLENRVAERTAQLEKAVAGLEESERALRLRTRAVDASGSGIVISDAKATDMPIVYVNPAFEAITGYASEEVLGKNCRFLQGGDRDQPALDELRAALAGGRDITVVLRNYKKDGTLFYNQLSVSPVFDEDGELTHFIGVQVDVTGRKRSEDEIRQLNETLEARVEERTVQLEEARDAAEEASRAKSDFLANMSHEIRTPMNGVIGMTELLLDSELSEEQREYAETVRASAENLLVVINDILDFSKMEAGRVAIETLDFDLRTAIEDVSRMLAERAHDRGLELIHFVEYDVPTALRGDPFRLRQVLTNLLGNAIKFTEEGEVVVRARLFRETENEAVVRLEVSDTGIGVTPEDVDRLFSSFSQADTSTTRRYGGTGLGLAISKQLVELMGGELGVESEVGAGSTFYFTVPFEKQPMASGPLPGVDDGPKKLGGLRVLVVDDNATNRKILEKQTLAWGMRSESVPDGPTALEELRSAAGRGEPYEMAVLDMQMPGMGGFELARIIKDDPSISDIRLVMLTSVGRRGDGEEARRAGVEAYLTKPVRQLDLYDALSTVMGRSPGTAEKSRLVTRHSLRERASGSQACLLLAEDNPVNQKVAAMMLEKLGYRVDVVDDGTEVLKALSGRPYAAVLMDVQMPEMDGYDATREVRRREAEAGGRRIPIIAMTANAMRGDRERAIEAGMDDYLPKPVKADELATVLERWTSAGSPEDGPEPGDGASRPASSSVLAQSVLDGLRDLGQEGEPDILAELVEVFLQDVPTRQATLHDALGRGDARALGATAHTLKGSCGNLGVRKMAETAGLLEETASRGDLSPVPALLKRLDDEFGEARAELSALLLKG